VTTKAKNLMADRFLYLHYLLNAIRDHDGVYLSTLLTNTSSYWTINAAVRAKLIELWDVENKPGERQAVLTYEGEDHPAMGRKILFPEPEPGESTKPDATLIEIVAQLIYEKESSQKNFLSWSKGGTSEQQEDARILARDALKVPHRHDPKTPCKIVFENYDY